MTIEIGCPGRVEQKLEEIGEGFGSTREATLTAARAQARAKLDLQVANRVCSGNCTRTVTAEPDFDCSEPGYEPWPDRDSPGIRCVIKQCRQVQIECTVPTTSFFDVPIALPLPEGEIIEPASTSIIAYVAAFQRIIFVTAGRVADALEALGAVQGAHGWQIPDSTDTFTLREVEGDAAACAYEAVELPQSLKGPLPGDRRVKDHHTCGSVTPGYSGPCRPIGDSGFYLKGERTPIAYCRFFHGRQCVEYYRRISTVGLYKDKDCQKPAEDPVTLNGWTCLGLF